MLNSSHILWIVIMAALGAKTAVITQGFHPMIGLGVGALVGFASLRFYKSRSE